MNSWLPCDKWQHLLGSGCLFNVLYHLFVRLHWRSPRGGALLFSLLLAFFWEVGQAIIWPIDWPDTAWDLVADCAGILTMWRLAR